MVMRRVSRLTLGDHTYKSGTSKHGHAGFRRLAAAVAVKLLLDSVRCQQVLPNPTVSTSPQPPIGVALQVLELWPGR